MNYKLELSEQEINGILQALGEMPAKVSMQLIAKIQTQCNVQIQETNKE